MRKKTVKRLRTIADRLDEAWWEYKMKYAVASFACVIRGVIAHRSGSIAAMGFGIARAVVSIRARFIKNVKDLEDNEVAEKLLEEIKDDFIAVKENDP